MSTLSPRFRRLLIIFYVILAVMALQYTFFSVSAVRKRMKAINEAIDVKLLTPADAGKDTAWLRLYKEKDWLETRFQIARTDSISLSVDLSDSTMQIELKGVVLKKTKILDFEVDRFLCRLNPGAYHHLLGSPARADTVIASIPREPLIIKKAPRDTTEVERGTAEIDTTKLEIVHWVLNLDNQVVLKIEGIDPGVASDWWAGHRFWMFQNLKQTAKNLGRTILFRTPEYHPEIRIVIPEVDARALYRAMPVKPMVCVRL